MVVRSIVLLPLDFDHIMSLRTWYDDPASLDFFVHIDPAVDFISTGRIPAGTTVGDDSSLRARISLLSILLQNSENIHYDLLRTGNVQVTSNKLIEKGFLPPPPPAYFAHYPEAANEAIASGSTHPSSSPQAGPSAPKTATANLITRLGLENRISEPTEIAPKAGGKAAWLSTAQEREASLRERKAQMVLAARQ